MEKILIEFQQAINRTIPKLEVIKVFLIQWYKEDFLKFIFGLALMLWPLVENFQMFIALLYVIGGDLIQPVGLLLCVYLLTKLAGKSKKKETDPTNINAFDRCLALAGSFLPFADLCRFFPVEVRSLPWLRSFVSDHLTGLMLLLNLNDFNFIILNILVFRGLIRRRGPDTQWSGTHNKFWIKYYIRYHWCYGSCLMTILEVYMYIKMKIFPYLDIPNTGIQIINSTVFYTALAILLYSMVCAAIGTTSNMPVLHGACEFHVGKPRKD